MPINPKSQPDALTLDQKRARYERIIAMDALGTMTDQQIGDALDPPLSRQRVMQIRLGGVPGRNGRPRAEHNIAKARKALALWEERRANRAAKGLPTDYAESRIAALSAELADAR